MPATRERSKGALLIMLVEWCWGGRGGTDFGGPRRGGSEGGGRSFDHLRIVLVSGERTGEPRTSRSVRRYLFVKKLLAGKSEHFMNPGVRITLLRKGLWKTLTRAAGS